MIILIIQIILLNYLIIQILLLIIININNFIIYFQINLQIKIITNINIGFIFNDDKLDNFAYILEDNPREHLGILWKTNKFGSKYFYVSFIDPVSGLFKLNDTNNANLMNLFKIKQFTKYGQYTIFNLRNYPVISYNNMTK